MKTRRREEEFVRTRLNILARLRTLLNMMEKIPLYPNGAVDALGTTPHD